MIERAAGVNIPVSSLRSKKSLGVGEFYDLMPFIDWAKEAGFKWIQLLPINDTSMWEIGSGVSPYGVLSAFALHPIYLNINVLAPEFEKEMEPIVKALNGPRLDYKKTYYSKNELLKMIYQVRGERDLASREYGQFFKRAQNHLKPYAAFSVLRDHFGTSDFRKWGKYAHYSSLLVDEVWGSFDVHFYAFVQFHLDLQLREVVDYARSQKILLKGDFPMGVHRNSVEAWRFFEYFRWDQQMGAPPDYYNEIGQNWGFPPYNWSEIKEEGYFWLKSRLKWMEQYFDAIRLDHVLGYFRIWEIPKSEVRGLMGNFYPARGYTEEELVSLGVENLYQPSRKLPNGITCQAQAKGSSEQLQLYKEIENRLFLKRHEEYHPRITIETTESYQSLNSTAQKKVLKLFRDYYENRHEALWKKQGEELLKEIRGGTTMEIFAEDIGVIPRCVEEVLKKLNIPNLHVQRMPKQLDLNFEDPKNFPPLSVCTPSNHDTATLRQWWEEDPEKTELYYQTILKKEGKAPLKLTEELAQEIIQAHLNSPSLLAMFLLQDLYAMYDAVKLPDPKEGRINDPALKEDNWTWRSHIYVEELLLAKSFTKRLRHMVKEGRR